MPIYAYRCESCGFEKDVLQKMSDAPLTQCPECERDTFRKQVTAAGFQLKGSGWYVTDFRGGSNGASAAKGDGSGAAKGSTEAGESKTEAKTAAATESSASTSSSGSGSSSSSTTASSSSDA
jgi:putative FmdB family regulatory protein